jgi:GTP cyclohydrolase I
VDPQAIEEAVRHLLAAVGEDAGRPGLAGTPGRVARTA